MTFPFQVGSFETQRAEMVRTQLEGRGIQDARVLAAMLEVPRHEFVAVEFRAEAYGDHPLPIGFGQTISQPYIVASMLQQLALQASDRVLEVGTGSGYATALLSRICPQVYSVERHGELAGAARAVIERLGYTNVRIVAGDGSQGLPEYAPFDAILVSAATVAVPPALFNQLQEDGRMIVPVGGPNAQRLQRITKVKGRAEVTELEGCRFVPLVESQS